MSTVSRKRVVVTGLGLITPLAIGVQGTWDALLQGKNGIGPITLYDSSKHEVHIAGEIKDFDPGDFMDRREARRLDRFTQLGDVAATEAIVDSRIDLSKEDTTRIGVVMGVGIGGISTIEEQKEILLTKGPGRVTPFLIPRLMGNAAAGQISIRHKLRGPNYCIVTACAAGANSLGSALRLIQYGEADVMIAGGTEAAITGLGMAGFANMKALSRRNDTPETASRPFDKERDGFVMAEGAGVLVLEELEHALKRDARIYAEFVGYGLSGDGHHITAPCEDGDGGVRAIQGALDDAGLKASEIDYINAHGTATPANDRIETLAIKTVFGESAPKVAISSTKSMTGHTLGAAGGVEACVSVLSVYNDKVHGTRNLTVPDPECDLNYLPEGAKDMPVNYVLSSSLGFGGHNGVVVFGKPTL